MTSASTVLQDEVSKEETEGEDRTESTDGDGEEPEKSLDEIIDAYAE